MKERTTVRVIMKVTVVENPYMAVGRHEGFQRFTVMVVVVTHMVALPAGDQLYRELVPKTTSSEKQVAKWKSVLQQRAKRIGQGTPE
jgi:hypothetical protein